MTEHKHAGRQEKDHVVEVWELKSLTSVNQLRLDLVCVRVNQMKTLKLR